MYLLGIKNNSKIGMKFDEARKKMVNYFDSNEFKGREDAETTLPAIRVLQAINKAGLLTTNSQTGEESKGFNKQTKKYYHILERAYLEGYMKRAKALKCIEYINSYTDKIGYFVYVNPDPTFEKLYIEGEREAIPSIPVTVSGTSTKSQKDIKELIPVTTLPTTLPKVSVDSHKKTVNLNKSEDVVLVSFLDPDYGRDALNKDGLFTVVLNMLKQIK